MPATRILQIIPSLDRAGAEKQFTVLSTHLARDEFDVHVCVLTRSGPFAKELSEHDVPFTVLGKHWKCDPAAFWKLKRLIVKLQPDIVQTWLFAANAYGRAAALAAGVKTIIGSEQCADPWKQWHQFAIDRYLAKRTSKIVVNGTGVCDFYVAAGIAAEKFVIIPNGIAPHQTSGTSRRQLLDELGLPSDARLVATIGRLWPQKRIKDIIWAAELLTVVHDDVHVLIIGEGPQRNALLRFRDQVQLQNRVHFLGHRDDVPRMIEHFDVLWQASGYEGLPNSIMEAMAAAVPVVATNIPGNRDLVAHGETGYLVSVGDRAGLARYANKVLEDTTLARRLGETAQQRMLEDYPVRNMVHQHAELYRELSAE